jgi:hypothetical protein
MTTLATVIILWGVAVFVLSKMLLVDPRGWPQLIFFMCRFGVWALAFFIIIWLTPIPW